MPVGDELNWVRGSLLQSTAPPVGDLRHHSKGGQSNHLLNIFRRLDGVIQIFKEKGESHTEEETYHCGEKKIQLLIRLIGPCRYLCLVHHLNITDRETGR